MSNPFSSFTNESYGFERNFRSYTDFVLDQVSMLEVLDSVMVSLGGKAIVDFRMTLAHVSERNGMKFKTKKDLDGNLWVVRVS